MPPKKKQEQIDLSTLPQCKTLNIFLYCKGKQTRANKILSKLDTKFQKMLIHVNRSSVLDHAKQKAIYVDPESLTDKQKKDPKFMETVCTQLTPQVLAKATDSYINNQNVKIRLQKKVLLQKPQTAQAEKNKKIDCIYIFDDFPTQSNDFQALAAAKQGIKFIFVYEPKISWTSAPEQPEPAENGEEQPNQLDQQYQQFKKLKQAEIFSPEDKAHQNSIQQKITALRNQRKKSSRKSLFRNTVIQYIKCSIDPYNQEGTIEQATNLLVPLCQQLLQSETEFNSWANNKQADNLPNNQNKQKLAVQKQKIQQKQKDSTTNILNKIIQAFKPAVDNQNKKNQEVDFQNFDFSEVQNVSNNNYNLSQKKISQSEFLSYNQKKKKEQRDFIKQMLKSVKYPGIGRFLMPQIPLKSQGLRKLYRSSFGQFLPPNLTFQHFQRNIDILFLQTAAKQNDEQRTYDFSQKIYQQQHNKQSLLRQLKKALLFDQSTVSIKYNQNNDKLYLSLLYKNPVRRMNKKIWQCNWKVLPNLQNWLKYFKENQTNLNNTNFYDIDYQLIGNILEQANIWSCKDSGVIVRKKMSVGGKKNQILYCLPGQNTGDLIFGLRKKQKNTQFYAKNDIVSLTHTQISNSSISTFITFQDNLILQLKQNGDILIRKENQNPRLIDRNGYTIIYENNKNSILHPNGGITYPAGSYINPHGKGLKDSKLDQISTLRRVSQEGQIVTRRDDKTTIVEQNNKKWISFLDKTQYLHENNTIIIQKSGYPAVKILGNHQLLINYNGLQIHSLKSQDSYEHTFKFLRILTNNSSQITLKGTTVKVFDGKTQTPYICQIKQQPYISKTWQAQSIKVMYSGSKYERNGKHVDPQQQQQNFNQQDVLRSDFIQPRVFIINNDNTGIQLLSENQLKKGYLQVFNKNNQNVQNPHGRYQIKTIKHEDGRKQIIHGVAPIAQISQLNKKNIKQIPINLDIFNNTNSSNDSDKALNSYLQTRSLIKHTPLTKEDRQLIAQIVKKRADYQTKSERQQNQYGFKPKNDPTTVQRIQAKNKLIEFRKLKQQKIQSQELKNEAINFYNRETQSRLKKIQNMKKQSELRKKLYKKKSFVSLYNWKQPAEVVSDQNLQFYNPSKSFYTNYFETAQGKKALNQMPEWVFRPKQPKKPQQLDPQIRSQLHATMNKTKKEQQLMNATNQKLSLRQEDERNERYDTVQPELKLSPAIYIKPSVFTQKQIDEQRYAFEFEKKAYQYHQRKRKDYDVYGRDRKDKMQVPSLMRTQPISQLNQKYLVTEAPVDKKVKISSMKNKLTSQASNMTQMRKEGPHANLIRTLDKGNDYSKLLQKRTMMVQADLNDRLQRDIQINPIQANFGLVKEGGNYQLNIQIKNQDVLAQRLQLKRPKSIFCKVSMKQMGPIALGMTRKVFVTLKAASEIIGKFSDEFQIITKHEIYHIPITAQILSKNQFESSGVLLSKTIRQFEEIGKKKREQLPPIKGVQ